MKTEYEKRYKNGIEYSILKAMGLDKPNWRINLFYLMLIAGIVWLAI